MEIEDNKESKLEKPITRRFFLEFIGLGAIAITTIGAVIRTAQFLSPNVLLEPSLKFKAGTIKNFTPDTITFDKEHKVYIVRDKEGLFTALSAVCTHLGCITRWRPELGIIACPCHGSKYNKEGKVINGPAPRPLPKFLMSLDEQGQIIVDKSQTVTTEVLLK